MKKPLTIGQFAKKTGLSPRAIRLYERKGLLSASRGESEYRHYGETQLEQAKRLIRFKRLGFRLDEIRTLLDTEDGADAAKLHALLTLRLRLISDDETQLRNQRRRIESILSSLNAKREALNGPERRYVMTLFQKVAIAVTGTRDLEMTAEEIRAHLRAAGTEAPILRGPQLKSPPAKPFIAVIPEADLAEDFARDLNPDVVVVRDIEDFTPELSRAYHGLYGGVGPHMATVLNADETMSIELAKSPTVQQGKIYYVSKNASLKPQIEKIGGVMSDGEEISVFGWNRTKDDRTLKLGRPLSLARETAKMAALAAVMDIGLDADKVF